MSLLDLSLLGLLADQPLHGYELKKRLADLNEGRPGISFGSLYPALNRLDREGLIESLENAPGAPLPMTGSLGAEVAAMQAAEQAPTRSRRTRRVYALTPAGQVRLVELLAKPADDDRTFAAQIAFSRHLSPNERIALLQRRRIDLLDRLHTEADDDEAGRFRDRYRHAARDRDHLANQSELSWLEALLIEEEQQLDGSTATPASTTAAPLSNPIGGLTR